jgi:RNA polymerase sigma-70 factor (ECF subfamily)
MRPRIAPEDDKDVQRMLAVRDGDESAFRVLFEKHIGNIVSYAMQLVGNRARAEEIAQEVFLQVYRHRRSYVPRARFVTWLYKIASNACISEARRAEHRETAFSLDQSPSAESQDPPAVADPLGVPSEDVISQRQRLARLQTALMQLPPQQRAAVLMARVEGLSYEEVATALSCSVSAVKSLIHRATLGLRVALGEEE